MRRMAIFVLCALMAAVTALPAAASVMTIEKFASMTRCSDP